MANFGLLTAENGSGVWGTPATFNGFLVLPSLLQRRRSPEANQTSHDVWPSPRLVYYIYVFGVVARWRNFARCKIPFTSNSCVLLYWQPYWLHVTPAAGVSQALLRGIRNGITELSQRAPPIFVWAAITLAIGPHSSYICSNFECQIWLMFIKFSMNMF